MKLQTGNPDVPYPYLIDKFWRHLHPTLGERIEFANTYRPWETGKAERYDHLFKNSEQTKLTLARRRWIVGDCYDN